MEPAAITVRELEGGAILIALRGRLDLQGVSAIEPKVTAAAGSRSALVVDLSGVTYIASMGMRMLLLLGKTVAARRGKMALLAPSDDLTTVLRTAGVDTAIPIHANEREALAFLAQA
jgi:anti-sigma B factor antagonist